MDLTVLGAAVLGGLIGSVPATVGVWLENRRFYSREQLLANVRTFERIHPTIQLVLMSAGTIGAITSQMVTDTGEELIRKRTRLLEDYKGVRDELRRLSPILYSEPILVPVVPLHVNISTIFQQNEGDFRYSGAQFFESEVFAARMQEMSDQFDQLRALTIGIVEYLNAPPKEKTFKIS
jgi:hypothetical protein